MKRYLVLAVFVLFLTGCATSNNVSENPIGQPVTVSVQNEAPSPPSAVETKAKRNSTKAARKTTSRSSKNKGEEPRPGPYSLEMKASDQDDDITKLLTTNYNQNFDIPIVFNDAVKYYIKWFSEDKKKVFANTSPAVLSLPCAPWACPPASSPAIRVRN